MDDIISNVELCVFDGVDVNIYIDNIYSIYIFISI